MNQSLSGIPSIYFCGHEHCQPGHSFGPAVRPHYLIHVVLSGKVSLNIKDIRILSNPETPF